MTQPLQSIGVIGGGSAGYISALYLKETFPHVAVTLIESSKIPVINVGEATTPLILNFLHHRLGIPVQEFFQETKPTLKLGVKFVWGKQGEYHYNNPFGASDIYNAMYYTGGTNACSILSMLMDAEKVPFVRTGEKLKLLPLSKGYAYHIDNQHFLRYMKARLLASGCNYVDTEIDEVRMTPDGLAVAALVDTQGTTHTFDLYLDCSGFRSLLLGKHLGTPWVDYSPSLKTNRAIVGTRPNPDEISPYTTATTLNHGWLWNTPMQQEDHLGYVFAKEFCSDDEAFAELKRHTRTINHERIVNFRTGRYAQSWSGNVVGVGNSFAFIEPLESTGLHMILRQLRSLTRCLKPESTATEIASYNDSTNKAWDNLRWFIALHFKFNARLDTPFWNTCRHDIDVSGIDEYLAYYREHGPVSRDPENPLCETFGSDHIFSSFAFDANLAGCGVNEQFFHNRPTEVSPNWPARHRADQALTARAIGMREAIRYMESTPCDFTAELGVLSYT